MMNKSMVIGLIGGIGIATAGGVAGYALLSQSADSGASGTAVVEEAVPIDADVVEAAPVAATTPAAAQRPAPTQQPVAAQRPAPAPSASATPVAARQEPVSEPVPEQRCWDEEVTVQAEPKDDKAIAGLGIPSSPRNFPYSDSRCSALFILFTSTTAHRSNRSAGLKAPASAGGV
jgi:uncharacterized protein YcfJ